MRHVPGLVIDYTFLPPRLNKKGKPIRKPHAVIVLLDKWGYQTKGRPWTWVRYHSSNIVLGEGEEAVFQTLHYFLYHPSDPHERSKPYVLPHESDDPEELSKVFAIGVQFGNEALHPPNYEHPEEVKSLMNKLNRRKEPSSWTMVDFHTTERLGVEDILDQNELRPRLYDMDFRQIPVLKTHVESSMESWARKKASVGADKGTEAD